MTAKPRDGNGKLRKRPVPAHYEIDQQRRANTRNESEDTEMKNQPSRHEFLRLRAAGKTHGEIESVLQLNKGVISYWLAKWELKGITQEKAAEMLAIREALSTETAKSQAQESPPLPADHTAIIESLRQELAGAHAANDNCISSANEAAAKLQAEIDEVRNDRDEWRRTAELVKEKSGERIRQLEEELQLRHEPVIVESSPPPAGFIELRFPMIDTGDNDIAGRLKSIETIGDLKGKPLAITGIDFPRLARDGFEIMQVIIGVLQAVTVDIAGPADAERTLEQFFGRHNEDHIERLRLMAEEHAWEVIGQ